MVEDLMIYNPNGYLHKCEDLFPSTEQSVGGNPTEGGNGNESVRIFQPDRGLDVLIPNVGYLDREEGDFSTNVIEDNDGRKALEL